MSASPIVLCLNSGSSSLKFALYQLGDDEEVLLAAGAVERIGLPNTTPIRKSSPRRTVIVPITKLPCVQVGPP
jgi:acetate kinase